MPHVTKHTPKVSTRSINPYARESWREKRQQGRQTDGRTDRRTSRHTDRLSKTTFLEVLGVVHAKSGHISKSIFCTMSILSLIDWLIDWLLSKILRVKFLHDLRVNKRLTRVRVKFGIVILNSSVYFHSNPTSENFHSRVTSETLTG